MKKEDLIIGKFITRTIVHPKIEIDCMDGRQEYVWPIPEGGLQIGKVVTRTIVHPKIEIDCMDGRQEYCWTDEPGIRPGIKLTIGMENNVPPSDALIHIGRLIKAVQDIDPDLGLEFDSKASHTNEREPIEIVLSATLAEGVAGRLQLLAERLRQRPMVVAPASVRWAGFADVLSHGVQALPPYSLHAFGIALVVGVLLTLGETRSRWVPSASSVGLGMLIEAHYVLPIVVGGVIHYVWSRTSPRTEAEINMPLASGLIVGEALLALVLTVLLISHVLS